MTINSIAFLLACAYNYKTCYYQLQSGTNTIPRPGMRSTDIDQNTGEG